MKQIAIFTPKKATVDEVAAAYALAEYLTFRKTLVLDRKGHAIPSTTAYVVRDEDEQWSEEAKSVADICDPDTTRRANGAKSRSVFHSPDIKIAVGVPNIQSLGEKAREFWGDLMEVPSYFVRPGKIQPKGNKMGIFQKKTLVRYTCTELVYDYISGDRKGSYFDPHISDLLYFGLYWNTKHFTKDLSRDTFQTAQDLISKGADPNSDRLHRVFTKPVTYQLSASWYSDLLSTAKENKHTLICHKDLTVKGMGMEVIERLVEDFHKGITIFYGTMGVSESPTLYCHVSDRTFQGGNRVTDASLLLASIPGLKLMDLKQADENPKIAYAKTNLSLEEVGGILEEQIFQPTEKNIMHLKANLFLF